MKKIKSFIKKEKKFIISLSILMVGQMIMYWFLKLFQNNPIYINFYLDDKIPFWGWFVYIYNMFYPFCIIAFYFLYKDDEKAYYKGIISGVIGYIICDIIFLFLPTIMYRPPTPNYDPITNFVLKLTYYYDEPPLNCFPSIHCLFCFQVVFSYLYSKCSAKKKTIVIIAAILIILSTLFVKQHFIYDVIAAFSICLIANLLENIIGVYQKFKKKKII